MKKRSCSFPNQITIPSHYLLKNKYYLNFTCESRWCSAINNFRKCKYPFNQNRPINNNHLTNSRSYLTNDRSRKKDKQKTRSTDTQHRHAAQTRSTLSTDTQHRHAVQTTAQTRNTDTQHRHAADSTKHSWKTTQTRSRQALNTHVRHAIGNGERKL